MDINDFRGIITALTLIGFLGVCAWAFSRRRKDEFDASAALPLDDDKTLSTINREKR